MLTFAWPYIFMLLPLPWLVERFIPCIKKNNEAILRVPILLRIESLQQPSSTTSVFPQRTKQFFRFCIWVLLLFACANPRWLGPELPITQAGHNIMLAIDLSRSMEIPDLARNHQSSNRLQTVKAVAAPFIDKRQGDKLGLILFGSRAYLETPLTLDRTTVKNMLDDATIGLAGNYTAIGDAITLAVKKLSSENKKSRILILFTDGGNNSGSIDPIEAAQLAKDNQIKIYTVGIGASEMDVPGLFGPERINPSADLDEPSLQKIAALTQGRYFRAQDDKALAAILESINRLEPIRTASKPLRPIMPLFYWPLTAVLLLTSLYICPYLKMR